MKSLKLPESQFKNRSKREFKQRMRPSKSYCLRLRNCKSC